MPNFTNLALLVIDMQKFFHSIAKPILSDLKLLITEFRNHNIPIIYTRHGHKDPPKDGGMLYEWWKELIIEGKDEWHFIEEIAPHHTDKIINKKKYSAFVGTELNSYLRSHNIEELLISGVLTNCCCETTARDAFCQDYRVFLLADATAAPNKDLQLASLKNLAYGFAYITTCEAILNILNRELKYQGQSFC